MTKLWNEAPHAQGPQRRDAVGEWRCLSCDGNRWSQPNEVGAWTCLECSGTQFYSPARHLKHTDRGTWMYLPHSGEANHGLRGEDVQERGQLSRKERQCYNRRLWAGGATMSPPRTHQASYVRSWERRDRRWPQPRFRLPGHVVFNVMDAPSLASGFIGLMILDTACQRTCCGEVWASGHKQRLKDEYGLISAKTECTDGLQFESGKPISALHRAYFPSRIGGSNLTIRAGVLEATIPLHGPQSA